MSNNKISFFKNEDGAETLEYIAVVAVIIGLGVVAYSTQITPLFVFDTLSTAMAGAVG